MGKGQDWCCICDGAIRDEASVGAGSGAGDGRDGDFAHRRCYDLRDAIKRGGSPTELAASLATFVRATIEDAQGRWKMPYASSEEAPISSGGVKDLADTLHVQRLRALANSGVLRGAETVVTEAADRLAKVEGQLAAIREVIREHSPTSAGVYLPDAVRDMAKWLEKHRKTAEQARGSWNRLAQHFRLWTQADGDDVLRQSERHVAGILIEIPKLLATYKIDQKG